MVDEHESCCSERANEISMQYDNAARWYNFISSTWELGGINRIRRGFFSRAHGHVLDVAAGTGQNLKYFLPDCKITAIDLSKGMLEIAQRRQRMQEVDFRVMDVEKLEFPPMVYDTVVSSLALCTYPHPVRALQEMSRVCKKDGRILLLEHGRSNIDWIAGIQDKYAHLWGNSFKCHFNRQPVELVTIAGLNIIDVHIHFLGIIYCIEAQVVQY